MNTKPQIGNIGEQQKNKRGWLVGQFMEGDFRDDNVEICCKTIAVGDKSDKLHKHPGTKEYMVVLKGRATMRVGDEIFEIKKGDYFTIDGNICDQLIEVREELTFLTVRNPSVAGNKVFV